MFELDVYLRDRLLGRTTFNTDEVRIGRGADNELQIDNLGLSRYHASIEKIEGLHVLKDFGSQNGTFVNGDRVQSRRALNDGDRIGLGKFVVLFRCDAPVAGKHERGPRIADEAEFAVAGQTLVTSPQADMTRERACPHVGYLAPTVQTGRLLTYPVARDVYVAGSGAGVDLALEGAPPRAFAILRGWRGFSVISLGPGVKRNGEALDLRHDLADGDVLEVAGRSLAFHAGAPEAGP
jgi:hypothetical protein